MDKKLLIAIAATALITATVTELIKSLFSVAKTTVTSETTKQNVRRVVNKTTIKIFFNVVGLIVFIGFLVSDLRNKAPINRIDILIIDVNLIIVAVLVGSLMWDLATWKVRKELQSLTDKLNKINVGDD